MIDGESFIERPSEQQPSERQWTLLDTGPEFDGPQPWCRVCKKPVALWARIKHEHESDLYVHCHNEEMHCLIPEPFPSFCVVEVFCYDDPHADAGFWWIIRPNGTIVQEGRRYIASNVGPSFFMSGAAKAIRGRRGGVVLGLVSLALVVAPFIGALWRYWLR